MRHKAPDASLCARTQQQVARVYGISITHVQNLLHRAGIARGAAGYDLFALGDWFRGNSDRFGGGETSPEADERALWTLRRERAEALKAEMTLDELRNRYCLREDVERTCREALTTCRLLLGILPVACAQQVPAKYRGSVQRDAAATVDQALKTLRRSLAGAIDPERSIELEDPLAELYALLEALPGRVALAVKAVKQRSAVERAAGKQVDRVRRALAGLRPEGQNGKMP